MKNPAFFSPKAVAEHFSVSQGGVYLMVGRGILPPPIRVPSLRRVAWPANEIDALAQAMTQGKSEADIRALAAELTAKRKS